jgi:translation initiation factor 2 subunit 1
VIGIAEEFPEKDELVLAIIRKILPYGAFCILPEYNNREAFLHVSEVAPRWIKNIHEFISEGQRLVVKVHRIDREKNHVDVSLKRVSEEEKKNKLAQVSFEKRAKKLLEVAIGEAKTKTGFEDVKNKIEEEYGDLYSCLKEASEQGEAALEGIDIPKALKAQITEVAKKNIKKQMVTVGGIASLTCYGEEGVSTIKKIFSSCEKDVEITYLGAPKYKISIVSEDYK